MTIKYDNLINILLANGGYEEDVPPNVALYIRFTDERKVAKDTITYDALDDRIIALNIDENNKVIGIEIL